MRPSLSSLLFLPLMRGSQAQLEQNETSTNRESLASIYEDVFFSYPVWPPLTKNETVWTEDQTHPIDVVLGMVFVSVDSIDPGNSEFTVSSRNIFYYPESDCEQTETHRDACESTIADRFKFFRVDQAVGSSTENMRLDLPDAHSQAFASRGLQDVQPNAFFVDNQITYKQTFDMQRYPYEFHNLEVTYTSAYSSNVVKLSEMPSSDPGMLSPTVPAGWKLHHVSCQVGRSTANRAIAKLAKGSIDFESYNCVLQVSRENTGWWITSFLLFSLLMGLAFIGGLGVASRYVADARDDKESARRAMFDATRIDGTFTVGLLLTYVFQVEISPYGKPIEHWPNTPSSTIIYVLGLVGIAVLSAALLIGSMISSKIIGAGGFEGNLIGGPYKLDVIPKEGTASEDEQPLVLKKDPEPDDDLASSSNGLTQMMRSSAVAPDAEEGTKGDVTATIAPIARSRKNNQKMYTVLSVEEAIQINKFVRGLFAMKAILLVSIFLTAAIILGIASAEHKNLIHDASQE